MALLAALRSVGGMSDAMTSRSAVQADCQVLIVGAGPTAGVTGPCIKVTRVDTSPRTASGKQELFVPARHQHRLSQRY
jgi:hypothetical protein